MALEQEVQARQADVTATQQIAQQMTALAPGLVQALVLAGQFASTLTSESQQLAVLASGVHDLPSAQQASTAAGQVQQQCQAALQPVGPAEQAWNSATGLAQQRTGWLQSHWQQCHSQPPSGTPIAMTDPLAQALNAYSAAVGQLDGSIRAAPQFPPAPSPAVIPPVAPVGLPAVAPAAPAGGAPAGPTGGVAAWPQEVAAWLQACSQRLATLAAAISADRGQLAGPLAWANLEPTAASAVTSAQALLAIAQRVAAALAGPVDPASLADRLSDLTTLRVSACPDPVAVADRTIYGQRMAELDQALADLLSAPTGTATSSPVALLPVRLETRTFPAAAGGTEFRIRVYVDSIHVNAHDPRLTADEAQWAAYIKTATAGGATLPPAQWAQLAARFGPARAAYLLNPDPNAGTRPTSWAQAATTMALPDRWLAMAYGPDGAAIGASIGASITLPLQVGPDPTAATSAASSDDLPVDPGVRWMIDFDEAVTAGMGISLLVDGGAAGTPAAGAAAAATGQPTLSRLLVVGVRAQDATETLTGLLTAHHFTSGLELVSYATPTNNTSDSPSGFSRSDPGYARSYALEVLRPATGGDAARLAAALGIDPRVFAAAAAAPLVEQQDQQAMTALTWPATWGSFLTGLTGMGPARAEQLRSWAVAWLRPGGPLPTLGVGPRVYGIVPVVAPGQWADAGDAAATDVHTVVSSLIGTWLTADPAAASLDFDALLARRPVTAEAWGRFSGIMPGWLQNGYDLMGVTNSQIQTSINVTLPGQLAQIGSGCGLPGPLTWPGGFLVLPDPIAPASPWPLVVPDGQLPLVAGSAQPGTGQPGTYLAGLLAGPPAAQPGALLQFVAGQAWSATPGVAGAAATFGPRGNLGDVPEPAPPTAASELHGAVSYLAGRADADFGSLFGGALDATAHRLDAWATALATRRLGQLRASAKTGVFVGGFSWVENLVARPALAPASVPDEPAALDDPDNAGYQLAPSLQQATTAAVLRSGYLTHNPLPPGAQPSGEQPPGEQPPGEQPPGPGAPFAIDLSSRRARLAAWLLDGIRQGQPLSVLLGYRFERALQEAGLGDLIEVFRLVAPYDPVTTADAGSSGAAAGLPTEAAIPTDVVDGVALYRLAQPQPTSQPPLTPPPTLPNPPSATQWAQAGPALTELADAIDAVADAVTAQALHDSLTASTYAAAATLDGVASGSVPPPELGFLSTPRTGIAVNHRVLVPIPAGQPYPPAGWPATPRGSAEPALTTWVAGLLGNPAQVTAAVSLTDQAGAPIPGGPTTIALSSLGLGPLDVVALAGQPAELERLAVWAVISAHQPADAPASGGTLDASPAGAARPLSAVLSVARSAGQLIGASRGADARDLAPAATVSDPGADLADLAARVNGTASGPPGVLAELASAAAALSAALPGDPVPGSAQAGVSGIPAGASPVSLATALVQAVMLGVPAAAPAGAGASALDALVGQARGAWAEIVRRQSAISALEPGTGADPPAQLAARLAQLAAALGGGFCALPAVTTSPANLLAQAAALTQAGSADPGQGAEAWLVKASRVDEPVADLLDTCCAAEALGTGPPLALSIAQLPLPAPGASGPAAQPAPWVGLPFTGEPPAANCLSLTMLAPAPPAGTLSALLVADWVEVIPSPRELTGLTYHYDAPDAQAPQAILLAVPASLDSTVWTYGDMVAAVAAARDLAHVRGVDYADLPGTARLALPAAYFANPVLLKPGPWTPVLPQLAVPPAYLVQTLGAVSITAVSVGGGALEQAKPGQITVTGINFAPTGTPGSQLAAPPPLPPSAFTVDGGGVTVTGGTVSNSQAILSVAVDQNATTGVRSLSVGSCTLPNCVTINPQPRATGCDTTKLSQGMTEVTQTITVTGQALAQASLSPVTGSGLVTWQAGSVSSAQVLVEATILASAYEPYELGDPSLDPASDQVRVAGGTQSASYRPPVHVSIPLTLTVTPAPGEQAAVFSILLDAII